MSTSGRTGGRKGKKRLSGHSVVFVPPRTEWTTNDPSEALTLTVDGSLSRHSVVFVPLRTEWTTNDLSEALTLMVDRK